MSKHKYQILSTPAIIFAAFLILGLTLIVKTGKSQKDQIIRSGIVKWERARPSVGEWGEMRFYFQGETFGTKNALTAMAVIKPGESLHPAHRHAEEEYLVVTKGSGQWHLDGEEIPAHEGDVLYVEPWIMHGLVNTGDKPLTFFVVKWHSKGIATPEEPSGDHGR